VPDRLQPMTKTGAVLRARGNDMVAAILLLSTNMIDMDVDYSKKQVSLRVFY